MFKFWYIIAETLLINIYYGNITCMRLFAISDLHLAFSVDKPMDIFGGAWEGYFENIKSDWTSRVTDDDVVLIAGDISWAMKLSDAQIDLNQIGKLKGKKVIIRGNHDYWWTSYTKVKQILPQNVFCIQNNAIKIDDIIICGTRGWTISENTEESDEKYINRELLRLQISITEAKKLQTDNQKIVVMMHYPPFNSKLADSVFTNYISEHNITTVVYGHLHGPNIRYMPVVNKGKTNYYLTSCDILDNKLLDLTDLI